MGWSGWKDDIRLRGMFTIGIVWESTTIATSYHTTAALVRLTLCREKVDFFSVTRKSAWVYVESTLGLAFCVGEDWRFAWAWA